VSLSSFVHLLLPPKSAKSREILRKFELIAVQGHPRSLILVSVESTCKFLLLSNSNYGRISYCFQDIDALSSKIACFFPPNSCLMPPSGGTPCNINVIYIPLKSTFSGLQFRRGYYGSIFIRLADVGSQICEITRNSAKI